MSASEEEGLCSMGLVYQLQTLCLVLTEKYELKNFSQGVKNEKQI